jgi:hypothetical protein
MYTSSHQDMLLKQILNKAGEYEESEDIILDQFTAGQDLRVIHNNLKDELRKRARQEERRLKRVVTKFKKE